MCDTFTVSGIFSDRDAVFAKNSDRYPGEPQFTQIVYPEDISIKDVPSPKEEYLNKSYKRLTDIFSKYSNPYGAILSRIPWMWGAEMGTNENGVTIGNEAVFSKVDKPEEDGLLGMDILRLALHNSETAKSALEFITGIISKYGQGGNGAFIGKLFYNNSFLIRDQKDAFVLETSGKNWGWKQINKTCSISNAYSPFSFDQSNIPFQTESFKKNHESKFYTFFSQGDKRRQTTSSLISDIKSNDLTEIFDILKYHDDNFHIAYGMRSICMHANFPVKSETRASWVTDYIAGKSIVWFTSSPNPCVSIFKPMIYDKSKKAFSNFSSKEKAISYATNLSRLNKYWMNNPIEFQKIKHEIDSYQNKYISNIYNGIETKSNEELISDIESIHLEDADLIENLTKEWVLKS